MLGKGCVLHLTLAELLPIFLFFYFPANLCRTSAGLSQISAHVLRIHTWVSGPVLYRRMRNGGTRTFVWRVPRVWIVGYTRYTLGHSDTKPGCFGYSRVYTRAPPDYLCRPRVCTRVPRRVLVVLRYVPGYPPEFVPY